MRSLLFAGATRPDLVAKVPRPRPVAAVIDLEDAVPDEFKLQARAAVPDLVERVRRQEPPVELYVRINAPATSWFAEDLLAVLQAGVGIVVPKLEEADQLDVLRAALRGVSEEVRLIVGIESARGVARVEELLSPPVYAAYFGAEDFIADMGGRRTQEGHEVLYARSRVVLAARMAGVLPVDQAVVDFRNDEAFRADARLGRELGYRGKICIHPRQVELANELFGPDDAELRRAVALLHAWERAAEQGVGAVEFDGAMIDEPALRMARQTLGLDTTGVGNGGGTE